MAKGKDMIFDDKLSSYHIIVINQGKLEDLCDEIECNYIPNSSSLIIRTILPCCIITQTSGVRLQVEWLKWVIVVNWMKTGVSKLNSSRYCVPSHPMIL